MREEIANLVHPVFASGLRLVQRLRAGENPSLEAEQANLFGLLMGESEARKWPEFGGDAEDERVRGGGGGGSELAPVSSRFLGIRYALVCWLDEMFVMDSPWAERWNEHKLEVRLYGSNDRAWRFWEQARLASDRPGTDALIAYFLCVMLGFGGELSDDPPRLAGWVASTRAQLRRGRDRQWQGPPELDPGTFVPPLSGRQALQRMILVGGAVLLALVPVVAFLIARQLS